MGVTPRDLISKYAAQAQMSSFFIDRMGIVNAKMYGAVPDTTNASQTAKIDDAVTAAKTNGSEVVYFPAGVYYAATALADSTSVIFVGDGASFSTQGSAYPIYQVWTPSIKTINNIEHHNADISMVAGSSDIVVTPTSSYTVQFDIGTEIKNLTTTVAQHSSQISTLQTETTNLRTDLNAHTTDVTKHLNTMTAAGDMVYNSTAATPVATRLPIVANKYLRSTTDAVPKPAWMDGPGADGAWERIASTVLATTALSVVFTAISTTYNQLLLQAVARLTFTGAAPYADVRINFNGDTGLKYYYDRYNEQFGGTVFATSRIIDSSIPAVGALTERSTNYGPGMLTATISNVASTEVAQFGQAILMDVVAPSTVDPTQPVTSKTYGWFKLIGSDPKITSIALTPSTRGFASGSYFALWGA